jgi:hypothetical protein
MSSSRAKGLMGKSVATYVTLGKVVGLRTAYDVASGGWRYLHVPWFAGIPDNDSRSRSVPLSPLANLAVLHVTQVCDVNSQSIQTSRFLISVGKLTSLTEAMCFPDLPNTWWHSTTQWATIISKSFPCHHHSPIWHCIRYAVRKIIFE